MMEVQGVVLECGIVVFGLLRKFLFDVCVNCGVGVFEAVCGKQTPTKQVDHTTAFATNVSLDGSTLGSSPST